MPVRDFLQRDPQEGAPSSEETEVRILFDTRNIYFGIFCFDSNADGIRATELRRDDEFDNDDIFELILDTFHDHRSGYLFRINPLGTQYDATVTGEGQTINANWDEKWEAKTRITENGWSAEIAIPFKTLRFLTAESLVWGVNFHRTIKRKNEDVFWTAHYRNFRFEEVSRAGHLEGLRGIQGFTLRFKPFITTGASRVVQGTVGETEHLTDVGIEDAKYMVTPQLALDLTVNPDFAQADVDEAQVNLTRFNLFFPEKREFFQEGSGIFQFGTGEPFGRPQVLLFHSRRIGLSESREEIPILGGLKLT
ncbi:MAG: carbohydrate binding family 9 domain-containing protein, partial [Acidobacteria bacterium]|nr:carbohydrate binding family 9 domain-containing protein [Acidobacteriota bacterium]